MTREPVAWRRPTVEVVELIDGWYWHDNPELHGPFSSSVAAEQLGLRVLALRSDKGLLDLEINRLLALVHHYVL